MEDSGLNERQLTGVLPFIFNLSLVYTLLPGLLSLLEIDISICFLLVDVGYYI